MRINQTNNIEGINNNTNYNIVIRYDPPVQVGETLLYAIAEDKETKEMIIVTNI